MDISTLAASSQASASSSASSQLAQNFDTFLTLLTTQLQNQDPLEPLDTEQFTQQLVQFASVEQSIQTNQNLEALIALQTQSASENALAMVGRVATVDSDFAALTETGAHWRYELADTASDIRLDVLDARGAVVASLDGPQDAGAHNITWDGRLADGGVAAPGVYQMTVTAISADGAAIDANVSARGTVAAVSYADGAPAIEIAGRAYGLDRVQRVDVAF